MAATDSPASHRRELTRHYKDALRPAGVYCIRNRATGRLLLGASLDVDAALNRHRFELRMRGHRNRELQADWLRLGPDLFDFEVLQLVKERGEPGFDYAAEANELLQAWRVELACEGARSYSPEGRA